jgi:triacylglycerol lipase
MVNEYVIVLHGLGRTKYMMRKLKRYLTSKGYTVLNIDYPSTRHPIEQLVEMSLQPIMASPEIQQASRIHFVGHSMGGILIRYFLSKVKIPNLGRVVMVSPPNQGSELAEALSRLFLIKHLFAWILGPAAQQLGTGHLSLPKRIPPIDAEIGVIMGTRNFNPLYEFFLTRPHDGKVSVAHAKLETMQDFLLVPATHTFIMHHQKVLQQVAYFLQHGKFAKGEKSE